ncbi:protein DpdG [Leptothrix sp. BB-4]
MSLLNLTSDGLPNILVVLYAAIAKARAPMTAIKLIEAVAPESVVKDARLAKTTLNRWTDLGLFNEDPDTKVLSLHRPPPTDMKGEVDIVRAVRMEARHVALSEANNGDLWAREEARAADLTRSLAWMLALDVYRQGAENLFSLANDHISGTDLTLMQNEARVVGLKAWGYFLGFVRHPKAIDIDPTLAISEVVPECIGPGEEMPARDLIEKLAQVLPVIDGGRYRQAVLDKLRDNALPPLQATQLSTSLSRALHCLMVNQTLNFSSRADVGSSILLTGRDGPQTSHRYTWVKRPRRGAQ